MSDIVLTDAIVRAATVPDGKREVYLREAGGLALRVRASGSKAFYFLYPPRHEGHAQELRRQAP